MGSVIVKSALAIVLLTALACAGGKLVAEHKLTSSNGFYNNTPTGWGWAPDIAADEKGNVCQFFFARGPDTNVTELSYKAMDKKGNVYSQGVLAEAKGAGNVDIPTGTSSGLGGFGKNLLLVGFYKGNSVEYVLYSLGKNGAEKLGSRAIDLTQGWTQAFMYKRKVVILRQSGVIANDDSPSAGHSSYEIKFYNKKFKETKKGGTFEADMAFMVGKGVAGVVENDPTSLTVNQYKP